MWPVVVVELLIALEVQICLFISEWEDVPDLRADADDARHEGTDMVAAAAVAGQLVVHIAYRSDQQLLGKELRCAPIEMKIDAVLIVGIRINVVVGEASDCGELVSILRVEIGVTGTAV